MSDLCRKRQCAKGNPNRDPHIPAPVVGVDRAKFSEIFCATSCIRVSLPPANPRPKTLNSSRPQTPLSLLGSGIPGAMLMETSLHAHIKLTHYAMHMHMHIKVYVRTCITTRICTYTYAKGCTCTCKYPSAFTYTYMTLCLHECVDRNPLTHSHGLGRGLVDDGL